MVRVRDPQTGKSKPVWHTVHGEEEDAKKKLSELLYHLDRGTYVAPSRLTVGQYLDKWLEDRRHEIAWNTYRGYKRNIELAKPEIGDIRLDQLKPVDLRRLYRTLIKDLDYSSTTARYVHRTLSKAFEDAVNVYEVLSRNPARKVPAPEVDEFEPVVIRTSDDLYSLLSAAASSIHFPLIVFLLATGLRRGPSVAGRRF